MSVQFRQNLNRSIAVPIVTLLCVLAVGVLQLPQLNTLSRKANNPSLETLRQDIELEQLRLSLLQKTPVFGFDNLLADWVYLNFLQYFGDDTARSQTGYTLSPDYFKIIVDRDPRFLGVYTGLSTSVSLYAAKPEQSVALMEKGLKSMSPKSPPQSYYVWRQKGIDELLFLGNAQAARQSFETAAEWASTYPDEESQYVASLSRQTAEFLARNPLSKSAQVSAWSMVLNNVVDQRTRQFVISRIEALGGKVIITPQGQAKIQLPKVD